MKITRVVHSLCCRVVLSPDARSERVWEDHQEKIAGSPTVLLESFPWYFTNITSKCQRYLGHECEVFNGSVIEQVLCLPRCTDWESFPAFSLGGMGDTGNISNIMRF